jgi:hypothetical protein
MDEAFMRRSEVFVDRCETFFWRLANSLIHAVEQFGFLCLKLRDALPHRSDGGNEVRGLCQSARTCKVREISPRLLEANHPAGDDLVGISGLAGNVLDSIMLHTRLKCRNQARFRSNRISKRAGINLPDFSSFPTPGQRAGRWHQLRTT